MNKTKQAMDLLKAGKLVILPTETVYGLACDSENPATTQEIYTVKHRPEDKALSILIPDLTKLAKRQRLWI